MQTKTAREVIKTAMEFLLKLKMDGFHVGRIHTDRGHEFSGPFKKWALDRGIMLTRAPGDDPRASGRVEVAVKSFKAHIRRLLKQAEVGSEMWPLAARYADALNRSWRIALEKFCGLSAGHAQTSCTAWAGWGPTSSETVSRSWSLENR